MERKLVRGIPALRIHFLVPFVSLLVLASSLVLLSGCVPEEGSKPAQGPSPAGTVEEYLPLLADAAYTYDVNQTSTRTIFTDYLSEEQAQQRTQQQVISGAEEYNQIITVKDGKATIIILPAGGLFRQNYLTDSQTEKQTRTATQSPEILLMEPLLPGTRWILADGSSRTVSDTALHLSTPLGEQDAISVVTENRNGAKTIDYYAKGIGLVKQESPEGTLLLTRVDQDARARYHIRFFYPDFSQHRILSLTYTIGFQTNDRTEDVLLAAYRNLTKAQGSPVLTQRAEIRSLWKTSSSKFSDSQQPTASDQLLTVDWNAGFLDLSAHTSVEEGMLLQCVANTLGTLNESQQVQLTVNGTPYLSRHVSLEDLPLVVSEEEYPLFYDLVVYGGTASGVVGAVSAAREGAQVAILEPGRHLGGMLSGGLGYTDRGDSSKIGGLAQEVFQRIGSKYGKEIQWNFEPHVAEQVMVELASEAGIHIYYQQSLAASGVRKSGNRITGILTHTGQQFVGRTYLDCSYEGDLMAQSGVPYTTGRESREEYGETLAGVRRYGGTHNFQYLLKATDANGTLYPEISMAPLGAAGQGDDLIQAYNYRICLTRDPANRIPFTPPAHYDPARYQLLPLWLDLVSQTEQRPAALRDFLFLGPLPGGKYDVNNIGPFSTDLLGGSQDYPNGSESTREEIRQAHRDYLQGLLYFAATDPSMPPSVRLQMSQLGYAADEFVETGNWPYQLYIRESRRMAGVYVMTQKDLQTEWEKEDSVGMGSYTIDSHSVQRYVTLDGYVQNEGEVQYPVKPYQIPYRALLPKEGEASNLLVPVCLSASHVAYSSLRMEPQYMILGEAAGLAAWMAIQENASVQEVSVRELQQRLRDRGGVLD